MVHDVNPMLTSAPPTLASTEAPAKMVLTNSSVNAKMATRANDASKKSTCANRILANTAAHARPTSTPTLANASPASKAKTAKSTSMTAF